MKTIRLLKWGGGYVTIPTESIRGIVNSYEGTLIYTTDNVYKVTASKAEIEELLIRRAS